MFGHSSKWVFCFVLPIQSSAAAPSNSTIKPNSVWVECEGDPDFLANCFERDKCPPLLPKSSKRENNVEECDEDKDTPALLLVTPA